MKNRRQFLKGTLLGALGTFLLPKAFKKSTRYKTNAHSQVGFPMVISTWKHGLAANESAMQILNNGGVAIDAVEQGVRVPEANPECMSVGYGGLPDRDGHVTLDACIMDHTGNCGAVSYLEHIKHPISVARKVMGLGFVLNSGLSINLVPIRDIIHQFSYLIYIIYILSVFLISI